jgi:hypothetical protein
MAVLWIGGGAVRSPKAAEATSVRWAEGKTAHESQRGIIVHSIEDLERMIDTEMAQPNKIQDRKVG